MPIYRTRKILNFSAVLLVLWLVSSVAGPLVSAAAAGELNSSKLGTDQGSFSTYERLNDHFNFDLLIGESDGGALSATAESKQTAGKGVSTIETSFTRDVDVEVEYVDTQYRNDYKSVKQTAYIRNSSAEDRVFEVTLRSQLELEENEIFWDGTEYEITQQPLEFHHYTKTASIESFAEDVGFADLDRLTDFSHLSHTYDAGFSLNFLTKSSDEAIYDWSDLIAEDREYIVEVYRQDEFVVIDTVISGVEVAAAGVEAIDPIYALSDSNNYDVRYDGEFIYDAVTGEGVIVADVNGDFVDDLIVSSSGADYNNNASGSVWLIFGGSHMDSVSGNKGLAVGSNYNIRFDGIEESLMTQSRAIAVGDVNGDSRGDLILGGQTSGLGPSNRGYVWVIFSTLIDDVGSTTGNIKPLDVGGNFNIQFEGEASSDYLTNSGLYVGDVNGDGMSDVVATSDISNIGGVSAGGVWIIFSTRIDDVGQTTGNVLPLSNTSNYNVRYVGDPNDRITYGRCVEIGDVNGDSLGDLVIGSQNASGTAGAAWVIFSSLLAEVGVTTGNQYSVHTANHYNVEYTGEGTIRMTEDAGVGIGDINGDSRGDLFLGARGADYSGTNTGTVWVMFSTRLDDYGITKGNSAPLSVSANYNMRIDGAVAYDALSDDGALLSGDMNGDSLGDLVVGAMYADNNGPSSGSVWIFLSTLLDNYGVTVGNNLVLSSSSSYNLRIDGAAGSDYLTREGTLLIDDASGDGLDDLVLGAMYADNNGSSSGSAWILYSTLIDDIGTSVGNVMQLDNTSHYSDRYDGASATDYLTDENAMAIGDINDDGLKDLFLGTSTSNIGADDTGSLWMIYFDDTIAPTGSLLINGGASSTTTVLVTLSLSTSENSSRPVQMQVSNDPSFQGASWESFSSSKSWNLTGIEGVNTVYVRFRDDAGNISSTYSDDIVLIIEGGDDDDGYVPPGDEDDDDDEDDEEEPPEEGEPPDEEQEDEGSEPSGGPEGVGRTSLMGAIGGVVASVVEGIRTIGEDHSFVMSTLVIVPAVTGIAALIAMLGMSFRDIPYLIMEFFLWVLGILGLREVREPWGMVYNAVTKSPVARAVVRVFSGKLLVDTLVSDINGIFHGLVDPGSYKLSVAHSKFSFPSEIVVGSKDGVRANVYRGEDLEIESEDESLQVNIPVDPLEASEAAIMWQKVWYRLSQMFILLNPLLLAVGVFSCLSLYLATGLYMFLFIILLYLGMFIAHWKLRSSGRGSWGVVVDSSGGPVAGVPVGLYDAKYGRLVDDRVTDELGRYVFVVPGEQYRLGTIGDDYVIDDPENVKGYIVGKDQDGVIAIRRKLVVRRV